MYKWPADIFKSQFCLSCQYLNLFWDIFDRIATNKKDCKTFPYSPTVAFQHRYTYYVVGLNTVLYLIIVYVYYMHINQVIQHTKNIMQRNN